MKDLLLSAVLLASFIFCYFVIKKIDHFIETNQWHMPEGLENARDVVRIAAETPLLLNSVETALEYCSDANPYMEFLFSSGKTGRICEQLRTGSVDIVLLTERETQEIPQNFSVIKISCQKEKKGVKVMGLPIKNLEEESSLCILWNQEISSRNRDRVLFMLEAKCGKCG